MTTKEYYHNQIMEKVKQLAEEVHRLGISNEAITKSKRDALRYRSSTLELLTLSIDHIGAPMPN